MSDMEGIVEESVSGSCTECSECCVTPERNRRTIFNKKCIKNKGKLKPKQKEIFFERNCEKQQETVSNKHDSLKLIKASESNVVAEKERIKVPISCSCPCIMSYIKFLNTMERCNCCRKKQIFNYTFANQDDSIETEKQGFSAIKKEPKSKDWKGTMKIITSSISLPFNLLKIRTNKKKKFLKVQSNYEKMFNEQQYLYGNGDMCNIPTMNKNMDTNKFRACEINIDKFTRKNDVRACHNHSRMSMDKIFQLCEKNNIQDLHGDYDETESSPNKEFKDCKEMKSSIIQEINAKSTENVAKSNIHQINEFQQTDSEIFSNLVKNDYLDPTKMQSIQNKQSVNVLCPLTELSDISRKEELHSKFRGKLKHNLTRKFNSLGSSQRRYVIGIRNNSNNNVKECMDKLLADMEHKSRSYSRAHKGLGNNTDSADLPKSDGKDIPKDISKLKQLLKDKIFLHLQECETSLYTCDTSCKIDTDNKSSNIKFFEIIKNYSAVMNDLETLCEKDDLIHNNQSSNKNMSEDFVNADNSENETSHPLFKSKNRKIPKNTSKTKLKVCNDNIIEPILEKDNRNDITYLKQNVIQKNMNISNKEEILILDSGDSVQETKISRFKSDNIETIDDVKDTEFTMPSSVNKKQTRLKRNATKAWQENNLTESDTTQSNA